MTTTIKNVDVRTITAGIAVSRPTSLVAQALTPMFTISGGRIILVSLVGELTIATDASAATTITIGLTPTLGAGTSKPAALAASTVVGVVREAGTKWVLGQTVGAALTIGTDAGTPVLLPPRQVVGTGVITYTGGVGVNPGSVRWDLIYVPMDAGTQVVANP